MKFFAVLVAVLVSLISIFGVWLIYWDVVEYVNAFLHSIDVPPVVVGLLLVAVAACIGGAGVKILR